MRSRRLFLLALAALAVGGGVYVARNWQSAPPAGQTAGAAQRIVPVDVATAVKKPMPVRVEALGTVTPVASVAIKARLETQIVAVHFSDGASVKEGDRLFTLDSRQIEARIRQAEGVVARDKAQLEGAERDLRRYSDLVAKNATPVINLDNAKTQTDSFRAALAADQAALDNLKVQLSYCAINAPISGRISAANVKVGNFVRPADTAPLATINQMAPIYVAFAMPQRVLPDVREAMRQGRAQVDAFLPGDREPVTGRLEMLDNAVDVTTGMVTARALMDNGDEMLWPGTLVNVRLTLRVEDAVVVPSVAVQTGQKGTYVFVVANGAASVRPVQVERTVGSETVLSSGLAGGEVVVVDGQLLLTEGTKVEPRAPKKVGS